MKYEHFLIELGIRSLEYTYTDEELRNNLEYFKSCWECGLSPYKALLFLHYNLPVQKSPNDIISS